MYPNVVYILAIYSQQQSYIALCSLRLLFYFGVVDMLELLDALKKSK
jgi:hypothetical protein